MFTFRSAAKAAVSRFAARYGAATMLSAGLFGVILSAAHADGIAIGGCVGGKTSLNCVVRWGTAGDPYIRQVPQPVDDAERQRSAERERQWEQRCRPEVAQDYYGVPRYSYAAPRCEFGVIQ